jgi:hypothetical protein
MRQMAAPEAYVEWINTHLGFNPRSQFASNALSDFVVADLRAGCPVLNQAFDSGLLVPQKNIAVKTKVVERNIDLVIRETAGQQLGTSPVAIEHKTIMTAHGKARKNRYGDIIAYSNHMHNHRRDCIAAAVIVINTSLAYANPDAFAKDLERPRRDMERVVRDTVALFASIPLRESPDDPSDQPEALTVILIDYDGVRPSSLVTDGRAPQAQDAICYSNFVRRICGLYERRHPQL